MDHQMIMLALKPQGMYDSQKKWWINNWKRNKNTIDYNKLWNNTMLNWIVVEVEHWIWLLTKSSELMLRQNIIKKQLLRTLTNTTRFGYVSNGKKKRFQDWHRCRQSLNDGDISITCTIIRYMGWWWKCLWQSFWATSHENIVQVWRMFTRKFTKTST
jgi:hypothetical protein